MQPQLLTVIDKDKLKSWTPAEWRRWWIEPKYDGARLIYHKGQFLSRTGKPLHNLEHIAEELKGLDYTFDGEVYGENWAATMSAARASKTEKKDNGLKFAVFDMMPNVEWEEQHCTMRLNFRRASVMNVLLRRPLKYVHVVPHYVGFNYVDFEILNIGNLANGCDGTVLKLADSLYEFKRTKTWLKVKPEETYDCKVVGKKEGTGKYEGMLGALEVLPEGQKVTTFVSGMDDEQRRFWWNNRHYLMGDTIEVKARGVHPSGRLIEPRFVRIREDKNI